MSLEMNACDIHGSSGSSISVESVIANHAPVVVGHVPGCYNSAGIFNKSGRVLYLLKLSQECVLYLLLPCTLSTLRGFTYRSTLLALLAVRLTRGPLYTYIPILENLNF